MTRGGVTIGRTALLGLIAGVPAGCVSVKAPDKPIEINLNINVKQEVVVSLKKDAEDFIANNPELFPK
ncbi:MAG TPA: YnbE family lipoprotein [Sphingomonas sp.]|nr:YnbE family lipoprotein [Sphingomonas sp.]